MPQISKAELIRQRKTALRHLEEHRGILKECESRGEFFLSLSHFRLLKVRQEIVDYCDDALQRLYGVTL